MSVSAGFAKQFIAALGANDLVPCAACFDVSAHAGAEIAALSSCLARLCARDRIRRHRVLEIYEALLTEDVALRIWRWDGRRSCRARDLVIRELMDEWSGWPYPALEVFTTLESGDGRVAVEFRIRATEDERYVEHNRSAFLTYQDRLLRVIDLYCSEPAPSARRKNYIAPATITEEELDPLLESFLYAHDIGQYQYPRGNGGTGTGGPG